ncbi:hypothetical protein JFU57_26775 [Pseudomonas sp. TH07]|uniref:hypothetical protein n=1 Tax=Pseudomonas sp. TH07 TaxID=2796373 RepID=UPI001912E053|nr:hypothetical protein [Pseudomonas sp. TH07]MBK5541890.1 hypothetical protein [Pseudomonas sp. TH07]
MKPELYEVWGDTVDGRHLIYSIGIGACVSLGAFFGAQHLLNGCVESAQMARAYAMLLGIVGCLIGGAVSARLFKPKRHVVEHQADLGTRTQVLIELQSEFGDLGRLSDMPPETIAELREMDLYELFAQYEQAQVAPATGSDLPAAVGPVQGVRP